MAAGNFANSKSGNISGLVNQLVLDVAILSEKMDRPPTVLTALTHTVVESDDDTLIYCTNATSTTVTLPVMEQGGQSVAFIQGVGAGQITLTAGGGVTLLVDGAGDFSPISRGVGSLVAVTWVTDTVVHITGSLEAV